MYAPLLKTANIVDNMEIFFLTCAVLLFVSIPVSSCYRWGKTATLSDVTKNCVVRLALNTVLGILFWISTQDPRAFLLLLVYGLILTVPAVFGWRSSNLKKAEE